MAKIKRSEVKSFLNTGTIAVPVWSLIGDGVSAAEITYNPTTETVTYIHEDNGNVSLEGYAPTMAIEMIAKNTDAVFEYLDALRKNRAILESAETEIVNVWIYETPSMSFYYAEKQAVSIQVDKFGGDGGKATMLGYTVNFVGNPVYGMFNPTTLAFVASPISAVLATLAIGSLTLAPVFATDKTWLYYTATVPNGTATVTMNSTCSAAGAVVVQYDEAATVAQGGTASIAVGINHLSVQVTVGSEVVTYYIDVTRVS